MSSQIIFGVTTAMLTGFAPVAVNYETQIPMSYKEETEKFETVQQFIDKYCSVKKIEFNEETEAKVETLELIKVIDEENYEQFLEGYEVYLTFDNEFKKEISDWYFNQQIVNENDLGLDVEPRIVTYESLFVDALACKQKVEREESQNTDAEPTPEQVEPTPEQVEPTPEYVEPVLEAVEPEEEAVQPNMMMLQVEESVEPKLQLKVEDEPALPECHRPLRSELRRGNRGSSLRKGHGGN